MDLAQNLGVAEIYSRRCGGFTSLQLWELWLGYYQCTWLILGSLGCKLNPKSHSRCFAPKNLTVFISLCLLALSELRNSSELIQSDTSWPERISTQHLTNHGNEDSKQTSPLIHRSFCKTDLACHRSYKTFFLFCCWCTSTAISSLRTRWQYKVSLEVAHVGSRHFGTGSRRFCQGQSIGEEHRAWVFGNTTSW